MFRNYLKVAYRNLLRQKGYSFLNVAGLAVALACTFLIALWVQDELRFDRFHEDVDQLYRVMRNIHSEDRIMTTWCLTYNIAEVLEKEYPEVEDVAITSYGVNLVLDRNDVPMREWGLYATPNFFDMLTWRLIEGEPDQVLRDPISIVISVSLAEKLFGADWRERGAALGQTVHDTREILDDFTVTGVFEDVPHHSSLQFDFVLPMEMFVQRNEWVTSWTNCGVSIFVRTREGVDGAALSAKITDIQNEHIKGFRSDLFLEPYAGQHLYSYQDGVRSGGRIDYVRAFVVVAVMIVLIACINFTNLATARSMRRAREVGVRKAVGAVRRSLVEQFMGESLLLVLLAFVLAAGLAAAALPVFNEMTEKEVTLGSIGASTLLAFAGIGVLTAAVAGIYPALYLSSFDAVRILRGTFRLGGGGRRIREGLVVFQFAMSILLLVGMAVVHRQIDYIHSKNLGLDRENVIDYPFEERVRERLDVVREELLRMPGIASVTAANYNPLEIDSKTRLITWRGKDPNAQVWISTLWADFDLLEVMRIELAEGRDFDPDRDAGSATPRDIDGALAFDLRVLINERARQAMGFESAIGERLSFWGNSATIVGVVKDFHMGSLYAPIEPTIIGLWPQETRRLFVRTEPGRTQEALASLEEIHDRFNARFPFEYFFLDERFDRMYRSETVVGKLAGYFAAFALFIACLGLIGLSSFMAQQRTKEIGVRKALGATVPSLAFLLSKDFVKLVVIAFVVAAPLSYDLMQDWLGNFAYRTEIGPGVFAITGTLVLLIALATVSYQSIKAALADPVKCLRYE